MWVKDPLPACPPIEAKPVTAPRARVIAFYLPQFHPIPENDAWWGNGFTEWTNVRGARPLFEGHDQPKIPSALGYYDLRDSQTRQAQAALAACHGVEGFCYWHYWFAGRRLLERPFEEVLRTGEPDFPFCLGWANESWTGAWRNEPYKIFLEQTYPGKDDERAHFNSLLRAFQDSRYIKVDGKPLLYIYRPLKIPESQKLFERWRLWASREGLPGLYIVGKNMFDYNEATHLGLDACVLEPLGVRFSRSALIDRFTGVYWSVLKRMSWGGPRVQDYSNLTELFAPNLTKTNMHAFPCVYPNWDNTPRVGRRGLVLHNSTPEAFSIHLEAALQAVASRAPDHRLVFIKSWNEWGEGNYMEPDSRHGLAYLQALRQRLFMDTQKLTRDS